MSTNNAADYSLTAGAATFTNNAGDSTTLIGGTPTPYADGCTQHFWQHLDAFARGNGRQRSDWRIHHHRHATQEGYRARHRPIADCCLDRWPIRFSNCTAPADLPRSSNDDWRSDQEAEIIATTIPPTNDLESAIVADLPANNSAYTAIVRGANNGTGIGVVEAYDLDRTVDSKLANISTRGLVQTGDNVLIGGFIIVGQNPLRVIVRAIGPSLGVPGALADPTLELHDGDGALIDSNDNWRSDQEAEIIATTIPPSNDLESAIVRDLAPGNYTAIVRGVGNATGVGLVEAYSLN